MAAAAWKAGLLAYGFSGHCYAQHNLDFCMTPESTRQYVADVHALREQYRGRMEIYLGVEAELHGEAPTFDRDYTIGSAHEVPVDGGYLSVDHTEEILRRGVTEHFGGDWYAILLSGGITILMGVLLVLFLNTRLGLSIRATGDNRDMVRASSINPTFTITVGLCVANALTGLSGAVVGQAQKTADINAGTGVVVIGLACLIIGETIVGRGAMFRGAIAVIVGSILYRFIYAIVLYTKVVPIDCLKLVTAIVVGLAIAAPTLKSWAAFQARKRKALAARKGEK